MPAGDFPIAHTVYPVDKQRPSQPSSGSDGADDDRGLFEILDAPLPSEVAREEGRFDTPPPRRREPPRRSADPDPPVRRRPAAPQPEPFEPPAVATTGAYPPAGADEHTRPIPVRSARQKGARRGRPARPSTTGVRRVKRTLKHIDPISVLKVSLVFYTFFLLVWLVIMAVVYTVLDGMGLFDQLESLGTDLVLPALQNEITLGTVEKWTLLVGVFCIIGGSILNAFLAFLYNIISDVVGGIEVSFNERSEP